MIYLVDDDPIQNMLTSTLIKTIDPAVKYKVFLNGEEVLEAIKKNKNEACIILLDINMPIMDGWEFLDVYEKFKTKADVYMLTSSNNNSDKKRAEKYTCIKGYYTKPVDALTIRKILSAKHH